MNIFHFASFSTINAYVREYDRPRTTFNDIYGNYITVQSEDETAMADFSHGNASEADAELFHYLPDDYKSYYVQVHTLREDDFVTMLSWPTTALIFITVPREQSPAIMKRVEEVQKSHKLKISVKPDRYDITDTDGSMSKPPKRSVWFFGFRAFCC